MAKTSIFILILISIFLHVSSTARSRSFTQTSILDVKASLKAAKTPLSTKPFISQKQTPHSSMQLQLQLHTRESLPHNSNSNSKNSNFKSLTLSRLARDSTRVNFLTTQTKTKTKTVTETPIISGTSQGSGEYFTRISIGSPPTSLYMVLDTGSDINWLQCAPCAQCYTQSDPIFQPATSSSYSTLNCKSPQCKNLDISQCRNNTCMYEVSYGDGSYTVGDLITETITLGNVKVNDVAIGCGHNNEGLFIGAAGLLGLGRGELSFPSQLNATSFSYCLVDRDSDSASTLEFGFNETGFPVNSITAPLLRNSQLLTFFYVDLTGVSVGGAQLRIPATAFKLDEFGNGGVIVDSGTAVTRLQSDVYGELRDVFVSGTRHLKASEGVALFDTCYDLSGSESVEVPTVSFHFGKGVLELPAKNYLIPVDDVGTFCLAFAATSSLSIIGNVQQQGTRVGFDLKNGLIGFTPSKC